jgi:peptidyl-dipeptidase A
LKAIKEAINAAQGGQSHFLGGDVGSQRRIEGAAKIGTVPGNAAPKIGTVPGNAAPKIGTVPGNAAPKIGTAPGEVPDPLLARQIAVLYLQYLDKQVDRELLKKMLVKSNAVERAFNVFRPKVDGRELTDNEIRRLLRESRDSAERRAAWEAGKKVGPVVVGDLLELVALRNQAARKLGFKNYHVLQLYCGEQSQEQVLKLFDELDELTREPFHQAKAEIDVALAKSYGITVAELRPWHYHDPFFQEVPAVLGELPDSVYKPLDPVKVCRAFYDGIGLPIDDVLKRSSLYEKPGKNPHAFCIDIDRAGDVRILENIVPGREWLSTSMHELGHAAYSENVSARLPYVLHTDAHPLCTEGVAMMFERFTQNVDWLRDFGAEVANPEQFRAAAAKLRRNRLLVFSRYCQVMFRFEAALYGDFGRKGDSPHLREAPSGPSRQMGAVPFSAEQDLNRLWWDLVEKYQEIQRPEGRHLPDFASKYHLIGAPAYYHNYMLGEMFASQVHHALVRTVLPGTTAADAIYVGNKAAGTFIKQRVFEPGLKLSWDELTRHATGEPLSPKAFAEDITVAR